mmetsp:Transcript_57923/g.101494  ORF Transcript_57923/g.101494 Transcript_57923/m.101494 type:complete len:342 (-) Transcript_57923:13-1038(-)
MGWGLASYVVSHAPTHEVWQPLPHGEEALLQNRCRGGCQTAWITSAAPAKAPRLDPDWHRRARLEATSFSHMGHAGTARDPKTMSKEEIDAEKQVLEADIKDYEAKLADARNREEEFKPVVKDGEMSQADLKTEEFEEEQQKLNVNSKNSQTAVLDAEVALERIRNNKQRIAELEGNGNVVHFRPKMASAEEEAPGEMSMPDPLFDQLRSIDPSISPPPVDMPNSVPENCRPGPEALMDLSREVNAPIGDLISIKPPLVTVEPPAPAPELPDPQPRPSTGLESQVANMPIAALYLATLGPRQMPTMSPACGSAAAQAVRKVVLGHRRKRRSAGRELAIDFL